MARILLSAVVLIISNLIVGSISLSLGLIVAVLAAAVGVLMIALLAVLGFCVVLERMGWLSAGWTDTRIDRLKGWGNKKWQNMPGWYRAEKKKIIEMTIEILKGKEREADEPVRMWQWVVVGLTMLVALLLVRQTLHISVGWSIVVVAVGSAVLAIPVAYLSNRRSRVQAPGSNARTRTPPSMQAENSPTGSEEINEALKVLVELHRSGSLNRLLDALKAEAQPQSSLRNNNQ